MVLEDAHWIDPTTLEMIEQSLDRIAAARVLMLLTSRPDDQPELATHPHLTRLTLNRLGRLGIEAIVARLGGGCLPTQTLDTIIARTDGVPLFVEELTKAILETGETSIPASLHDSLMARFDRLPEAKDVAQIAACIGREFSHALLAEIADRDEPDLIAVLDQLLGSELVFRRGLPPDAMYSFKHALLQDAAYQSLLKSRRRDLHARVVEALEARSENLEAAALGVLANHCARAGLAEKASDYWYRAGQQAIARSAMVEAVEQLGQGLEALAGLRDGSERRRKELDLQIALGGALIGLKGHGAEETGHAFARARALCHEVGDAHRLMPVLGGQLGFDIQRGAPRAAHEIASAMLELAEQHADSSLLIQAHRGMSSAALELGHFAVAREHAERLLAIYDPARHSAVARGYAYDMRTVALGFLAQALFALGYPDQARRASNDQISLARRQAHSSTLAQALSFGCIFRRHAGDVEGLSEVVSALHTLADEQALAFFLRCAQLFRGWLWVELGRTDEGLVEAERAATAFADAQEQIMRAHASGLLAEAYMTAGRSSEALRWADEAITWTDNGVGLVYEGEQHRCHGHVLLALSERDEVGAEASFCRSINIARAQDAKMRELRAATSLAGLWAEQGERQKALDLLAPVYDWFTEGFDTPDLIEAKALLGELS
jgi:predicted ATPase